MARILLIVALVFGVLLAFLFLERTREGVKDLERSPQEVDLQNRTRSAAAEVEMDRSTGGATLRTPLGVRDGDRVFRMKAFRQGTGTPILRFSAICECGLRGSTLSGAIVLKGPHSGDEELVVVRSRGFGDIEVALVSEPVSTDTFTDVFLSPVSRTMVSVLDEHHNPLLGVHVSLFPATEYGIPPVDLEKIGRPGLQLQLEGEGAYYAASLAGDTILVTRGARHWVSPVPINGGRMTIIIPSGEVDLVLKELGTGDPLSAIDVSVHIVSPDSSASWLMRSDPNGILSGLPGGVVIELVFPPGMRVRLFNGAPVDSIPEARVRREALSWALSLNALHGEGEEGRVEVELSRPPRVSLQCRSPSADLLEARGIASIEALSRLDSETGDESWWQIGEARPFTLSHGAASLCMIEGLRVGPKRLVISVPGAEVAYSPWVSPDGAGDVEYLVDLQPVETRTFRLVASGGAPIFFAVEARETERGVLVQSAPSPEGFEIRLPAERSPLDYAWSTKALGEYPLALDVRTGLSKDQVGSGGTDAEPVHLLEVLVGTLTLTGEGGTPGDLSLCHESGGVVAIGRRKAGEAVHLPTGRYWWGAQEQMQTIGSRLQGQSGFGVGGGSEVRGMEQFSIAAGVTTELLVEKTHSRRLVGAVDAKTFLPKNLFVDVGWGDVPSVLPWSLSRFSSPVGEDGGYNLGGFQRPPDWLAACVVHTDSTGVGVPFWFDPVARGVAPPVIAGWIDLAADTVGQDLGFQLARDDVEGQRTLILSPKGFRALLGRSARLEVPVGRYRAFRVSGGSEVVQSSALWIQPDRGASFTSQ